LSNKLDSWRSENAVSKQEIILATHYADEMMKIRNMDVCILIKKKEKSK
jgi:hypothetical protein